MYGAFCEYQYSPVCAVVLTQSPGANGEDRAPGMVGIVRLNQMCNHTQKKPGFLFVANTPENAFNTKCTN